MMNHRQLLINTFLAKNSQLNLSAIRDEKGILVKHIQDSLEVNTVISFPSGASVVDVGTGGGFPLLPLAMTNPDIQFTGIDSVRKKTIAVNEMIERLGIGNAKVVWGRIEEIKMQTSDFVIARAVAYVDKLILWSHHLVKKGGKFILMKQKNKEEKAMLLQICKKWKLTLETEHYYSLFEGDIERVIYILST